MKVTRSNPDCWALTTLESFGKPLMKKTLNSQVFFGSGTGSFCFCLVILLMISSLQLTTKHLYNFMVLLLYSCFEECHFYSLRLLLTANGLSTEKTQEKNNSFTGTCFLFYLLKESDDLMDKEWRMISLP